MVISILTLFPEVLTAVFNSSIIKRAKLQKKVTIRLINIRDFTSDKHHTVDDAPYGGGVGMLLKIDILHKALEFAKKIPAKKQKIVLLDPTGKVFNQATARKLAGLNHLILICGHYEGIDARIENFIDEKISIGKYILTGGELPSIILTDAIVRLIPGVLNNPQSNIEESFSPHIKKEAPQYTRPAEFKGLNVPEVLLSGNHQKINNWKKKNSL